MKNNNFAVFIITHGRPNNIYTDIILKKCGYTGKIYYIIDNEDKTSDEYYKKYGDSVIMFDKKKIAAKTDCGDNTGDLRTTTHVRNATFEIAKKLNLDYFLQLDDDYTVFRYNMNEEGYYNTKQNLMNNINNVFDSMIDFLKATNIKSIAMSQGGDFIGADTSTVWTRGLSRKCMNSFFFKTDNPIKFIGRLNEDVNTYCMAAQTGDVLFTFPYYRIEQKQTQLTDGGMSETYRDNGTYQKSFFSVMYCPSFVKISMIGVSDYRIHHNVLWENAAPKIIKRKYKKDK